MIYLELFYTFFIIGLFGFGGGYGMLSLIQTEKFVNHHWLSSAEFTNIFAVSQNLHQHSLLVSVRLSSNCIQQSMLRNW